MPSVFFAFYPPGGAGSSVGANTTLSNLTPPTAINVDLLPASADSVSLGSAAFPWMNLFLAGYINFVEISTPATPVSGTNDLYFKSDGNLYMLSSSGTEHQITGANPLTTKGDLYTYSTAPARLPVGTNGYILNADSTQTTGLAWRTFPQVVSARYDFASGGQSVSGTTLLDPAVKVWDTDNAVSNASGHYVFTCPTGKAGHYTLNATVCINGSLSSTQHLILSVGINGTNTDEIERITGLTISSDYVTFGGSTSFNLNAGDTVTVYAITNGGTFTVYSTIPTLSSIEIVSQNAY